MFQAQILDRRLALEIAKATKRNLDEIPFVQRDDAVNSPEYGDSDLSVFAAIAPTEERSRFKILERMYVDKFFPEVAEAYEKVRAVAEEECCMEVITSPFYRSSINLNLYDEQGACHAAHYDTNPLANILCLSEGAPLQVKLHDRWWDVVLKPGELLMFNGRDIMHRVPAQGNLDFRLVASMNLYFPNDCQRPDGLDEIMYGTS